MIKLARFAPAMCLVLAFPAAAQTLPDLDKRVTRLERQVDRVSRRVLPKGEQTMIAPEVSTEAPAVAAAPPPAPASAASVADLTERLSAIERRQGEITNTLEEQGNRLKVVEERLGKLAADAEARLGKLEGAVPPPVSGPAPTAATGPSGISPAANAAPPLAAPAPAATPTVSEGGIKGGLALYQAKKWPEAEAAFQGFADTHPKDKALSAARYWIGRSAYNDGAFDRSARVHFDNYKTEPKGDHAQESLFWVGQSLFRLKRLKEACQVYDLAAKVYDTSLKAELVPQFAAARVKAGCH